MATAGRSLGIGVIGTGFMGACHALAFREAPAVFQTALATRLEMVADLDRTAAEQAAVRFGFRRATGDWRELVADPAVEVVAIATPNALHKEMALAAIAAGKAVYCEKPMALSLADARDMAEAARRAGVPTLVGYNYLRNPAVEFARRLIEEGEIGAPTYFRGLAEEDYMADVAVPFSWRCRRDLAGSGALGDLGSHIVSIALYLLGPVEQVMADVHTVVPERPLPAAGALRERRTGTTAPEAGAPRQPVENEDMAHGLLRFASGVRGQVTASRVAWGRKNRLAFEIHGTRGSLVFDQERMNELCLYTPDAARGDRNGFRTILIGPQHPHYAAFLPAPGHGLGFSHLKVIEVAHLLDGLADQGRLYPTFEDALAVERVLAAILQSAAQAHWVSPAEL